MSATNSAASAASAKAATISPAALESSCVSARAAAALTRLPLTRITVVGVVSSVGEPSGFVLGDVALRAVVCVEPLVVDALAPPADVVEGPFGAAVVGAPLADVDEPCARTPASVVDEDRAAAVVGCAEGWVVDGAVVAMVVVTAGKN